MTCFGGKFSHFLCSALCLAGLPITASASPIYTLTSAEENYTFLSSNFTVNQPPTVSGNVGLATGGTFTLSKNTLNGEVDFQGAQNDNETGTFSVTGGEFSNFALVGTALSDAQALAGTIAGLTGTATADITASQTFTSGVYDVTNINLGKDDVLTISGSATDQFVFRISGTFTLGSNAEIVFSGAVNPDNVLFYYTGGSAVSFGGSPTAGSMFQGLLLDNASSAQTFTFDTHTGGGPSEGRAFNISGGSIVMSTGVWNGVTGGDSSVPEPATWPLLGAGLALVGIGRLRKA